MQEKEGKTLIDLRFEVWDLKLKGKLSDEKTFQYLGESRQLLSPKYIALPPPHLPRVSDCKSEDSTTAGLQIQPNEDSELKHDAKRSESFDPNLNHLNQIWIISTRSVPNKFPREACKHHRRLRREILQIIFKFYKWTARRAVRAGTVTRPYDVAHNRTTDVCVTAKELVK